MNKRNISHRAKTKHNSHEYSIINNGRNSDNITQKKIATSGVALLAMAQAQELRLFFK